MAQMGDAKSSYSQTLMDGASAERIGHLICSQSFLEEVAVGYLCVNNVAATRRGLCVGGLCRPAVALFHQVCILTVSHLGSSVW